MDNSTKTKPVLNADLIESAIKAAACIVTSEAPATLTKTRKLDKDTGSIISQAGGFLVRGTAENITIKGAKHLAAILNNAKTNQALIAASHNGSHDSVRVYSTSEYEKAGKPANAITRTNSCFNRSSEYNGLLILDCDDKETSKEQFLNAIRQVIPLDDLEYVYTTSSSSYLYIDDTPADPQNPVKGQRLYIFIDDASLIPEAGKVLFERLWLAGHGHYEVSKSGSYLERGIIDSAMFSENDAARLDFIGGSNCIPPVTQKRPPAEYNEGRLLKVSEELKQLTGKEETQLESKKMMAKADKKDEADEKKAEYCEQKGKEHLEKQGIKQPTESQLKEAIKNVEKALETEVLTADFVITLANGEQLSIGQILAKPELYDRAKTLDPIEPSYDNYGIKGILYLTNQRPILHSFAHGGKKYRLLKQSRLIQHEAGSTAETTNETLRLLQSLPEYFDMGGQLVKVEGGHVTPMSEHLLGYELGSVAQYYSEKTDSKGNVVQYEIDPPLQVVRQILSMNKGNGNGETQRGLKALDAVITAPTITPSGHVVYKRGYDTKTRLYLSTEEEIPEPPKKVTPQALSDAYRLIMDIIDTSQLNSALSKSVVLSAYLTAVTRPTVDKAPMFAFDAPVPASGKTYLSECIGSLALGQRPSITPAIQGDEAETKKTLLSKLMEGERVIIWDNIMGSYNSATLAAFVTAPTFSGRVLGSSQTLNLPNKAMVILTGNNLALFGDLPRRTLTARIDTGEENPLNTKRDLSALGGLSPIEYISKHRQKIAMACITIIRAYLNSFDHLSNGKLTEHKISSFEDWDTLARQPIEHLRITGVAPDLVDIKESIDANMGNDPEKALLAELLRALSEWSKCDGFTSRELYDYVFNAFDVDPQNALRDSMNGNSSELRDILNELCVRDRKITSRSIGKQLAYRKEKRAGGRYLKMETLKNNKGNLFSVVES